MAENVVNDELLIESIDKDPGNRIHVRLSKFRERNYLDIRNFYETEGGEWKPTRKGISVPIEFYEDLMAALGKAKTEIDKRLAEDEQSEKAEEG